MTPNLRWTIRARITALVAALVTAAGAIVLLANYWWLTNNLPSVLAHERGGAISVVVEGAEPVVVQTCAAADVAVVGGEIAAIQDSAHGSTAVAAGPSQAGGSPAAMGGDCVVGLSVGAGESTSADGVVVPASPIRSAIEAASLGMTTVITRQLGQQSVALLVALMFAAVIAGWFAARRALAPIHAMSERARMLGAASLSERLPLAGPRDEISELGTTFNGMLDRVEHAAVREHRLVANLAHELRTPLANQRVVLEVALEGHANGGDGASDGMLDAARTALQQNLRTQRLVEHLMMLARIEQAGDQALQVVDVDLVEAVGMLVAAPALAGLGPAGVQIRLDLPDAGRPTVRAEPVLLDCLIGNLLENAVRHNVPGGTVWVSCATPHSGAGVELSIQNTGPVVPADVLPCLFEPLRQGPVASRERQRGRAGVGLGLSLVVAIAQRFGVALRAEPRVGGGLTVRLRWPAQRDAAAAGSSADGALR